MIEYSPLLQVRRSPRIGDVITRARDWLLARQDAAGFWRGELEGDSTLESYMILLEAFFGRRTSDKVGRLAQFIRSKALPAGGWSQYPGGPPEVSVSCLSYFALKVAGDGRDEGHMQRALRAIDQLGGVGRANTYTKYHLALFGQYSWADVPAIPPEMIFLPRVSPFSVYDMSAWSRTIFVPLSILYARKPVCALPPSCGVSELFDGAQRAAVERSRGLEGAGGAGAGEGEGRTKTPPAPTIDAGSTGGGEARGGGALRKVFFGVDRVLKLYERLPGAATLRRAALARAAAWMIERLEDSDGLSAILPAMANAAMALRVLGYADDHPLLKGQLGYLDGLLLPGEGGSLRMQPCLSPVWDTVIAAYALAQAGLPPEAPALRRAATWLLGKQCRRPGDWAHRNPAPPGGWYFEHRNEFYPDVDDTCMALLVLQNARADVPEAEQRAAMTRGLTWLLGMQNSDGGWASFDRDNDKEWLTQVPFADHNAMIDPSTADITGRVLECLATFPQFGVGNPVVTRALEFLRRDQISDGCWYGRWGVNYIYGTWQVLRGLRRIGEDMEAPYVRRAVRWLEGHQNADGGWGESIESYDDPSRRGMGASTPSQTAWALMGLVAAGEEDGAAVQRGVAFLAGGQTAAGTWEQEQWSGTGFPRVFYLNYQYYRHYFPMMALAQYRLAHEQKGMTGAAGASA